MGRILLVYRLAARDLRRHPAQAVLLLVAVIAATGTLTLGIVLDGVTSHPYLRTRAVTAGPDVVIAYPTAGPRAQTAAKPLINAPGVIGHSGPYTVAWVLLRARGLTATAAVEGRGQAPAPIDQPQVTQGSWVRDGGVVIERSFADALGVDVGDPVILNGKSLRVTGLAVTAASPAFPGVCSLSCATQGPPIPDTGVVWVTDPELRTLGATTETSVLNLELKDPDTAPAFVNKYTPPGPSPVSLESWQSISDDDGVLVQDEQRVLSPASWLLLLLALASVAVMAGGRMAEQTRRVGLLKAVGSTPGLVAAVLIAENLGLAVVAAAAGLVAGWLAAPLLAKPGAGLVGAPGAPLITVSTIAIVIAVALVVALAATLVPAIQAARTSTVSALADSASAPRRRAGLNNLSARLPVPLLLGLRLAARRPRRTILNAVSVAVVVTGIVAVLTLHATNDKARLGSGGLANPVTAQVNQVILVLTIALVGLAAVNAVFTSWATVLDATRPSALARAFGATPQQVARGLSAAQLLPALAGGIAGIPLGMALYAFVNQGGSQSIPPAWWLVAVVLATLVGMAALTAVPARIGARRSVAEILQSETA